MSKPRIGDVVRLDCPHEPKWDGLLATVHSVADTHATVTHRYFRPGKGDPPGTATYRAGWHEMTAVGGWADRPDPPARAAVRPAAGAAAKAQGYEGEACGQCGAMKLRRNGACMVCDECGTTTGCS